jgi:hypothetical protein
MTALGKYGNRGSEGGSDRVTCGANQALPSTAKPTLSNLIFASPFEVSIVVTNPQLPQHHEQNQSRWELISTATMFETGTAVCEPPSSRRSNALAKLSSGRKHESRESEG